MNWKSLLPAVSVPLLLFALVAGSVSSAPVEKLNPFTHCPINGKPFAPDWKFCPWHGTRIGAEVARRDIPERTPKETVLAFFQAYQKGDRQGMADVLDLESILEDWLSESLGRWKGLPPELQELMSGGAAPQMAEALAPIVLDILASREMRETYRTSTEIIGKALAQYEVQEEGDRARLNPRSLVMRDFASQRFYLRKKDGHWVITRLPFFGD